jgi:ribonuclease R
MDLSPDRLLAVFEAKPGRPFSLRDVLVAIGAAPALRVAVGRTLQTLVRDGRLIRLGGKRFMAPERLPHAEGILHVSAKGTGFLMRAGHEGEDLYVHNANLGSALDGDRVAVEVFTGHKGRQEGRVCEVLWRAHEHVVGQLKRTGGSGLVMPRNVKIGRWIEVQKAPPSAEAPDGAWVRAKVTRWPQSPDAPPTGEIEEVLGMPGDRGISVLVLLRDAGVDLEFPPEVERQVAHFHAPATAHELARRRDLRGLRVCTIDPATAKDFDDALSIEVLESGNWWLGVHIADVAHYVHAGKPVDLEALRRGTSIYPVDRVVPMLPERLSNDLCSLRPNEDRYTLTCFMEITPRGQVVRHEIVESVICSRHRFSYEQVQEFFDRHDNAGRGSCPSPRTPHPEAGPRSAGKMPALRSETGETPLPLFADMEEDLLRLREVARLLNRIRMERGALDLDLPETEVECNDAGDAVGLHRHARFESHRLVEECMLLANETVASHMRAHNLPLLYRIHDVPDPASLARIAPALECFGVKVPKKVEPTPAFYQAIVDALHRVDGGHIGQRLVLGTLMRAEYSPTNRKHFGLASPCYCHFTSPIRRYPDLLVHRVLKQNTDLRLETGDLRPEEETENTNSPKSQPSLLMSQASSLKSQASGLLEEIRSSLAAIANQSNLTADNAESIENEAVRLKAMEFMKDQEGGIFEGWISCIVRRGFLVELVDLPVEGMVSSRSLPGDIFAPDEHYTRLRGRHTSRTFRLGQRVRVVLARVNAIVGEMELLVVEDARNGKRRKMKDKTRR